MSLTLVQPGIRVVPSAMVFCFGQLRQGRRDVTGHVPDLKNPSMC